LVPEPLYSSSQSPHDPVIKTAFDNIINLPKAVCNTSITDYSQAFLFLFLSHTASTATAAAKIAPHVTIMLLSPVCTTFLIAPSTEPSFAGAGAAGAGT
jgi:hypothetical protein